MCLNAGLDSSFCPIFTSAQLQEGYFSYMVGIFLKDILLQHVVSYEGQRCDLSWEVVQAGALIFGDNGRVRNLS